MTRPPPPAAWLFAAFLVGACSPAEDSLRPALSFPTDGAAWAWSAAHDEPARLVLGRVGETPGGAPALILGCRGEARGGVSVAAFRAEPVHPPLELTAGAVTLTVPARAVLTGGQTMIGGEGPLPSDWFDALAAAERLDLRYGDQGLEVEGPGRDLVDGLHDRCRGLDRGAG